MRELMTSKTWVISGIVISVLLCTSCSKEVTRNEEIKYEGVYDDNENMAELEQEKEVVELYQENVIDSKNSKNEQANEVYVHNELDFKIEMPKSWNEKYRVQESDLGVTFYHNVGEASQTLFAIVIFSTEAIWDQYSEEEKLFPYKEVGRRNELIYGICQSGDIPYNTEVEEERKWAEEYDEMIKEINQIATTFELIEGDKSKEINVEWYKDIRLKLGLLTEADLEIEKIQTEYIGTWTGGKIMATMNISSLSQDELDEKVGQIIEINNLVDSTVKEMTKEELSEMYVWNLEDNGIEGEKIFSIRTTGNNEMDLFYIDEKLYVDYGGNIVELVRKE